MKKEVITFKNPKSPISEIFRTLRTNMQFMNVNKKMQAILVTSTSPGEGKSWIATNLAVTFAQAGKRVIIVDSDMRKGRQYAILGVPPKPGLSDFLSQEESIEKEKIRDYIQATEIENLYVMTAGTVPPNPSELLVSTQMIDLLEKLKNLCDIVIIDGTPTELVTDSLILSRLADSTIIVTSHKSTKKEALKRVIRNIENVDGKIAGIIINKMPISLKKYGERYYYYGKEETRKAPIISNMSEPISKTILNESKPEEQLEKIKQVEEMKKQQETLEEMKEMMKQKEARIEEPAEELKQEEVKSYKEEVGQDYENINVEAGITNEEKEDILNQINKYLESEKKPKTTGRGRSKKSV